MRFRIERAVPGDAAALSRLHAEALPPGWPAADFESSCASPQRLVFKALDGPRLCGLLALQHAGDEAEVLTLAAAHGVRRRGVGSDLLKAAIEACRTMRILSLYLEAGESNIPAISLYEKAGFETIARRKNYYRLARSAPETALIMKLDTRPALTQIQKPRGTLKSGGEHGGI